MNQVFLNLKNKDVELQDIPSPALRPGGVLVRNHFSLISSGTERQIINLGKKNLLEQAKARPDQVAQFINKVKTDGLFSAIKSARAKLGESLALGYSCAGEIIEVAPDVQNFKVGDFVACAGQNYASHAEIIFVPKNLCVKIPEGASLKSSSFVTLGAIAMQGIRRANLTVGETVVVIGLGLIGQLTVQILKAYGFSVIGCDTSGRNVERAKQKWLGQGLVVGQDDIPTAVAKFSNGKGADAVIITASTESSEPLELAGKILREKGRVSVVGDVGLSIPRKPYYEKELDFYISRSYGPGRYDKNYEEKGMDYPIGYARWTENRNMEEFLRLCAKGLVSPEFLITEIFGIERYKEAYDLVLDPARESTAVLFSYGVKKENNQTVFFRKEREFASQEGLLNVGLIGTGNFAKTVILPVLKKIDGAYLKAVASADGKDAMHIADSFGSVYVATNYEEILNDKDIQLVIVATRHNLHAKIAIEALRKNKNVHIEKPLAMNESELKEIIEAAKNSNGRLMVGFNRRFAPAARQAKEFLGAASNPLFIQMRINAGFLPKNHWTRDPVEGGGRIIGEACHFIDLAQYLAGSPVQKVFASSLPMEKTSEDDVLIFLSHGDGSQSSIIYTTQAPPSLPKEHIEIIGGGKAAIIDNFKAWSFYQGTGKKTKKSFLMQDKGHEDEFRAFAEAIKSGKQSPIAIEEAENSTLASFKILESLREGIPKEID